MKPTNMEAQMRKADARNQTLSTDDETLSHRNARTERQK